MWQYRLCYLNIEIIIINPNSIWASDSNVCIIKKNRLDATSGRPPSALKFGGGGGQFISRMDRSEKHV
jgi:hypothetical protein